jgi:hypothetical protein
MKRILAAIVLLLVSVSMLTAGVKRIVNWPSAIPGSITVTIDEVDSTGWLTTDKMPLINLAPAKKFNRFIGSVILADLDEVTADSVTGEGNCDTLIVRYYAGTAHYKTLLEADTVTLPGTTFVAWNEDIWADPTATTSTNVSASGDSAYGYAYVTPKLTGDWPFLMYDHFWFDYYVSDSAGGAAGGDGLTGTLQYWFRFIEDE